MQDLDWKEMRPTGIDKFPLLFASCEIWQTVEWLNVYNNFNYSIVTGET